MNEGAVVHEVQELALIPSALAITRTPEAVLQEAHQAAAALKKVIDAKPRKLVLNGKTYLEFEDWQTVGRFYGIAPRITQTRYVVFGNVAGWEATAEAVHIPSGRLVSTADAMCLNDEEKWASKPKYDWCYVLKSGGHSTERPPSDDIVWEDAKDGAKKRPKRERIKVGDEAVPLYQLRSMAQTRAGAKALRNALAWVVVLAGYGATPAEELDVRPEPAKRAKPAEPENQEAAALAELRTRFCKLVKEAGGSKMRDVMNAVSLGLKRPIESPADLDKLTHDEWTVLLENSDELLGLKGEAVRS